MAIYNTLQASLRCPRCGVNVDTEVNCYFGYVGDMADLKIGDRYPWRERVQPQNGGRPEGGSVDGEGYMECPLCHKDSFLRVIVRADVITGVEPDTERRGYVPD
jgi:uncharacterized C2H2 Zn-finger protein